MSHGSRCDVEQAAGQSQPRSHFHLLNSVRCHWRKLLRPAPSSACGSTSLRPTGRAGHIPNAGRPTETIAIHHNKAGMLANVQFGTSKTVTLFCSLTIRSTITNQKQLHCQCLYIVPFSLTSLFANAKTQPVISSPRPLLPPPNTYTQSRNTNSPPGAQTSFDTDLKFLAVHSSLCSSQYPRPCDTISRPSRPLRPCPPGRVAAKGPSLSVELFRCMCCCSV